MDWFGIGASLGEGLGLESFLSAILWLIGGLISFLLLLLLFPPSLLLFEFQRDLRFCEEEEAAAAAVGVEVVGGLFVDDLALLLLLLPPTIVNGRERGFWLS